MSETPMKLAVQAASQFTHNPSYGAPDDDYIVFPPKNKLEAKTPGVPMGAPRESEPAAGFLKEAQDVMEAKAKLRDTPNGERTAAQIAKVFNALTGHSISETDAWAFLMILKMVRSRNGKYNRDDYVDLSAYSGLMGECASRSGV